MPSAEKPIEINPLTYFENGGVVIVEMDELKVILQKQGDHVRSAITGSAGDISPEGFRNVITRHGGMISIIREALVDALGIDQKITPDSVTLQTVEYAAKTEEALRNNFNWSSET